MCKIVLVVNQGLKSTRCIAFNTNGDVLAQSSRPIETIVSNECVEQDPVLWRSLTWKVLKEVTGKLGKEVDNVEYLTVTTSASCLVAVDANGESLRNSILVSDTRTNQEARNLEHTVEFQQVLALTGNKSSPDLMIPKILWLARHEPEVFRKAAHFLNAGDYLNRQLTGKCVTDSNNALKFHYVLAERSYPLNLLRSLRIDEKKLPQVADMGTDIGLLLPAVADEFGLPASCRVILSTYDALAAVVGSGVFDVGQAVDISGTVTSFRAVTDRNLFDPERRIYVTSHLGDNYRMVGGSNNLGGGIIEWLRQLFYESEDDPYATIEQEVESQPLCPGGLIFLPHLLGERAPIWNPECRGVFFGLNRSHSRPQFARAVLEGVAFSVRHIAEVVKSLDVPINSVNISGGLARLDTMNQIKADVLGVPINKLENFETTAIGAALICLLSQGVFANEKEAFEKFCRISKVFEPDRERHTAYSEYFELYCGIYESLRDAYQKRAGILSRLRAKGIDEFRFRENL